MEFLEKLISLLEIPGLGRKKIRKLINKWPDFPDLSLKDMIDLGMEQKLINPGLTDSDLQLAIDRARLIREKNEQRGIKAIPVFDKKPFDFSDGPILLYFMGNFDCLKDSKRAAVIGSRRPGPVGGEFAFRVSQELSKEGYVIISGLARGCDTAAHQGCLSQQGQTVAFLPGGLLNLYPPENRYLAEEILAKEGCLISEYPLATEPKAFQFIERDRLQAGASDFVVVSTFSLTGGTIHTLKYGHQYSKKIYSSKKILDLSPDGFKKLTDLQIAYEILSVSDLLNKIKA